MRQTHVCGHALLSTVWEQILHLQVFDFLECTIELQVAQALLPMTFRETLLAVLKNIAPPSFLLDHKCWLASQWRWLPTAIPQPLWKWSLASVCDEE